MSQEINAAHVYIGVWTNWSRSKILGSTLTLSDRDGGLLTAFLAIFVTAAGGAFWRIVSYIVHQIRSKRRYQDGLHHQQQVIFRNASSPDVASWQLGQLLFHWWHYARRPALRILPLTFLALTNLILFALAGVFSARVTTAPGNETLIISPHCGTWETSSDTGPQEQAAFRTKTLLDTTSAATYARSCYGQAQNTLACTQYAQQNIPWLVNQNASCPFAGGMCKSGDTSAYQMDTGPIDSHQVLGINAPSADRITYRKVSTCSPTKTKGYTSEWNNTNKDSANYGDTFELINYGPFPEFSDNFTYEYDEHTASGMTGYQLWSIYASPGTPNGWIPIPELNRTDADVSIFLLAQNAISYDSPVSDPFFSANSMKTTPGVGGSDNLTTYITDKYISALGCVDQHQICNPSNHQCSPLTGFDLVSKSFFDLSFNVRQSATAWRVLLQLENINMYASVHGRGSNALRASETLSETEQVSLPNNQWQIEVDSWMAVGMAKLQQLIVQYATGPPPVVGKSFTIKPQTSDEEAMCGAQKVRSSVGTTSFSVLGVAIILLLGALLVLTNLVLDVCVGSLQRKYDWGDHKRLQWVLDEKLQLQRLAYEEAGQGVWSGGAGVVPTTRMDDRIGIPRNVNKAHPKLSGSAESAPNGRPESITPSYSGLPQSDMTIRQTAAPEAETLMGVKGAWYDIQTVETAPSYRGY